MCITVYIAIDKILDTCIDKFGLKMFYSSMHGSCTVALSLAISEHLLLGNLHKVVISQ